LGDTVTQLDAALRAFCLAFALLSDFLTETNYNGHIGIFAMSSGALVRLMDYTVLPHQHLALEFASSIDTILSRN